MNAKPEITVPRPRKPGRLLKRLFQVVVVFVLLTTTVLIIASRSFVLIPIIEPMLADIIGGEVRIGSANIEGLHGIVLKDVVVRSKQHRGIASEVIYAGRIRIDANLLELVFGGSEDLKITLSDSLLRISEDENNPGSFSFQGLGAHVPEQQQDDSRKYVINVLNSKIEVGSHNDTNYTLHGTLPISGTFHNLSGAAEWFSFDVEETDEVGNLLGNKGLRVRGRVNFRTLENEGRVDGLVFNERIKSLCPSNVLWWWDQLDLDGRVNDAAIRFDADGKLWANIDVKDVGLTIPVESNAIWSRYAAGEVMESTGMPRMRVDGGQILLSEGKIILDNLSGELISSAGDTSLAGVPYKVRGEIGPIPDYDWGDREEWVDYLINKAPLGITFFLDGFELTGKNSGPNSAVELPSIVANILKLFTLKSCTLHTNVEVSREPPKPDGSGGWIANEIQTSGEARLKDGQGAYDKFPYPLENVRAHLKFNNQRVDIVSLIADGIYGGSVSIGGYVAPLNNWPHVDLSIYAEDLPLDETLQNAMSKDFRQVMGTLMHKPSYERLLEQNAIPDEEFVINFENDLIDRIRNNKNTQNKEFLARRASTLERLKEIGRFEMGGTVNLDININREEGEDNPTYTTGDIEIQKVGLVVDYFPYPITVTEGKIEILKDGAVLHDLKGIAVGGGTAVISGEVKTEEDKESLTVKPTLKIGLSNDALNPALVAAIPLAGEDDIEGGKSETGKALAIAGRLLGAAGLDGIMSYEGWIKMDENNQPDWDIAIVLDDGLAAPSENMTEAMASIGLFWPDGFTLDNVEGSFQLTRDKISIPRLAGNRGRGSVVSSGSITVNENDVDTSINIKFNNFTLEEYLLNLFPKSGVSKARKFWNRYKPTGVFDASLHYHNANDGTEPLRLEVKPKRVSLTVGGAPVVVIGEDNWTPITLSEGGVAINDLTLNLESNGYSDGVVTISGGYDISQGEEQIEFIGKMENGRFESPWMVEILRVIGADEQADHYLSFNPAGTFDATFEYAPGSDVPGSNSTGETINVHLIPHVIEFTLNDHPLRATLDDGSSIRILADTVNFESISGNFESGAAFAVLGEVKHRGLIDSELQVSYKGRNFQEEIRAFIPTELSSALDSINLTVDGGIQISNATVQIRQLDTDDEMASWYRSFNGPVEINGLSFNTGLDFTDVSGRMEIIASSVTGQPPLLEISVSAHEASVMGWEMNNVEALLFLSESGTHILLPHLRADLYNGVVTATASAELAENGNYSANLDMVGIGFGHIANATINNEESNGNKTKNLDDQGSLYGHLSISGKRADPSSRRGRGSVRVLEGKIAHNPIMLPLIQLLHLTFPIDASLGYAEFVLYMQGDQAYLERVFLEGNGLMFVGDGTVGLDDFELDIRLRSRGRILGISELVGSLNDQLYAIHVSGSLKDPEANVVPLPGLGGFFSDDWFERDRPRPNVIKTTTVDSTTEDN